MPILTSKKKLLFTQQTSLMEAIDWAKEKRTKQCVCARGRERKLQEDKQTDRDRDRL